MQVIKLLFVVNWFHFFYFRRVFTATKYAGVVYVGLWIGFIFFILGEYSQLLADFHLVKTVVNWFHFFYFRRVFTAARTVGSVTPQLWIGFIFFILGEYSQPGMVTDVRLLVVNWFHFFYFRRVFTAHFWNTSSDSKLWIGFIFFILGEYSQQSCFQCDKRLVVNWFHFFYFRRVFTARGWSPTWGC